MNIDNITPILGRFSVDVSINQTNGVAAGKMVNQFLNELPALRGLVLIVKSFLNQRSMNEVFSGGLGSYSIVCLAISFLQVGDFISAYMPCHYQRSRHASSYIPKYGEEKSIPVKI